MARIASSFSGSTSGSIRLVCLSDLPMLSPLALVQSAPVGGGYGSRILGALSTCDIRRARAHLSLLGWLDHHTMSYVGPSDTLIK